MRVNAAIVASLTGAAFAYPVLDSYKEVTEVPAYSADPHAAVYSAPNVYGDKPVHSAPKPKQETNKQVKTKETPAKQKQVVDDCISKRSALGLDFSACTKGALSGSLGNNKASAASKAAAAPKAVSDTPAAAEPKEPFEPAEPIKAGDRTKPTSILNTLSTTEITKVLSDPDVTRILSNPVDFLPIGDITEDRTDQEVTDSKLDLPIGANLDQLLPSSEGTDQSPESDPLSAVSSATQQLQKSGILPKRFVREVRPAFTADGTTKSALNGKASADRESANFDLAGSFAASATGTSSLSEREALQLTNEDDEEDSSLTGFLIPTTKVDDESGSLLAPLGLTGTLDGAVKGSASASSDPVKRTAVLFGDKAESAALKSKAAGSAQGKLSGSASGLSSDEKASVAAKAAANANSDLSGSTVGTAAGSLGLAGNLAGQFAGSATANKREAQLTLDAVTALLAPLTGAPAAMPGAPAKRQLGLDAVTGLLAPITGAPAPGAPAKRQLDLKTITALLGPLTGAPAPAAGGAPAKRQLDLKTITALLGPLTGAPAPAAGGAPAKRDLEVPSVDSADFLANFQSEIMSQLEGQLTTSTSTAADAEDVDEDEVEMMKRQLDLKTITALLGPLTGAPAPAAGGAPAKRQLDLKTITALLGPLTGAPAPAAGGAPAKRSTDHEPVNLESGETSIQCIKGASGKCITTGSDEEEMFDPAAPQYHGSLDIVEKLLPLDYVKHVVPV